MCHVLARPLQTGSMMAGLFSYLRSFERGDVFAGAGARESYMCVQEGFQLFTTNITTTVHKIKITD